MIDLERLLVWVCLMAFVPKSELGYSCEEWRIRKPISDYYRERWPS